jgi:uncharacterized membrane protein
VRFVIFVKLVACVLGVGLASAASVVARGLTSASVLVGWAVHQAVAGAVGVDQALGHPWLAARQGAGPSAAPPSFPPQR